MRIFRERPLHDGSGTPARVRRDVDERYGEASRARVGHVVGFHAVRGGDRMRAVDERHTACRAYGSAVSGAELRGPRHPGDLDHGRRSLCCTLGVRQAGGDLVMRRARCLLHRPGTSTFRVDRRRGARSEDSNETDAMANAHLGERSASGVPRAARSAGLQGGQGMDLRTTVTRPGCDQAIACSQSARRRLSISARTCDGTRRRTRPRASRRPGCRPYRRDGARCRR